jgi:hypothetical protein
MEEKYSYRGRGRGVKGEGRGAGDGALGGQVEIGFDASGGQGMRKAETREYNRRLGAGDFF